MAMITFWAGYEQIKGIYLPNEQYLLAFLAFVAMMLMLAVFVNAFKKWHNLLSIKIGKRDYYGDTVKELVER